MQLSQSPRVAATFDDANLLPLGGVGAGDAVGPPGRVGIVGDQDR